MKDILILSARSARLCNSDVLCHQFMKGAQAAGHHVELISLYERDTAFLSGLLCLL